MARLDSLPVETLLDIFALAKLMPRELAQLLPLCSSAWWQDTIRSLLWGTLTLYSCASRSGLRGLPVTESVRTPMVGQAALLSSYPHLGRFVHTLRFTPETMGKRSSRIWREPMADLIEHCPHIRNFHLIYEDYQTSDEHTPDVLRLLGNLQRHGKIARPNELLICIAGDGIPETIYNAKDSEMATTLTPFKSSGRCAPMTLKIAVQHTGRRYDWKSTEVPFSLIRLDALVALTLLSCKTLPSPVFPPPVSLAALTHLDVQVGVASIYDSRDQSYSFRFNLRPLEGLHVPNLRSLCVRIDFLENRNGWFDRSNVFGRGALPSLVSLRFVTRQFRTIERYERLAKAVHQLLNERALDFVGHLIENDLPNLAVYETTPAPEDELSETRKRFTEHGVLGPWTTSIQHGFVLPSFSEESQDEVMDCLAMTRSQQPTARKWRAATFAHHPAAADESRSDETVEVGQSPPPPAFTIE